MATKPPAKSKNNTSPKSNTAKPSGLNKAVVFDKKIVALIAVALIVLVGYLYVRLSRAGSEQAWYPADFQKSGANYQPTQVNGEWVGPAADTVTKSDGRVAVVKEMDAGNDNNHTIMFIDKVTKSAGRYCFEYKISGSTNIAVESDYFETVSVSGFPASKGIPTGQSWLGLDFPAGANGAYNTACTIQVVAFPPKSNPTYRRVILSQSHAQQKQTLWITKAWFEPAGQNSNPSTKNTSPATPTPATPVPATKG